MNTNKGGYRICEEDRQNIHTKDLCGICNNVLKTAIQTECGHRYCFDCLEEEFNKHKGEIKCKICEETLTRAKIFRDKFADREIQTLILFCIYCTLGCKWRGQLKHRQEHQKTCKFIPLPCVNRGCDKQVTKETLPNHLQNECQYREVLCSYCNQPVIFNKIKEHEDFCPNYIATCEFCKKEFPRQQLLKHKDPNGVDICEKLVTSCPYKAVGCKESKVMNHKERLKHQRENVESHLNLTFVKIQNLLPYFEDLLSESQNGRKSKLYEIMRSVCDQTLSPQMNGFYNELKERMKNLEEKGITSSGQNKHNTPEVNRRMDAADAKSADLEFLLNEAHTTIAELRQELTKTNVKLEKAEEAMRKMERRLEEQENVAGIRNLAVADLEEKMNGVVNNSTDGILVWKIDQVARRRGDATSGRQASFYSPPFYTDPHGYKMCARIYLNGDGMGKGTHISLFFVIMRGEYDPLLKWPFRQKVTMMLLDQDSEEHVIDAFRPDPNSSSFQKPRGAMNIASGCPMFCPHSELQRHAYIRDDVMFIKIIVDRPDWK